MSRKKKGKRLSLLASYRREMPVQEAVVYVSALCGETEYFRCPRCHITMEREFTAFCDRCGQRLGWEDYKRIRRVCPGRCRSGKQNNAVTECNMTNQSKYE